MQIACENANIRIIDSCMVDLSNLANCLTSISTINSEMKVITILGSEYNKQLYPIMAYLKIL